MNDNGGAPQGPDEPTSYALQPPQARKPHPDNPYAAPRPEPTGQTQAPPQPRAHPQPQPHPRSSRPHPHPEPRQATEAGHPAPVPEQAGGPGAGPGAAPGVGRLVAGRYRLLSRLGHGGMGTVWRAKDETVDREVAVKEPRVPEHLGEQERATVFERMRREARAAARLDHPAVVTVHDVAVVDGRPWIVMELVHGRSLGDALQEGTLDVREAARIGLEVLGALRAAHAAGVLHRDVKPDNVLLGRHDRVVLTDFGIAQIEGETRLTDTGGFVGSPEYIAPERVLGRRPGPAADLWSLGVLLYAATEGVSPFRRSNTPATLQAVLNATPAPPAAARGPLAELINALLQKDPAHRPDEPRVRALLERAAAPPPAQAPTQVVSAPAPEGGGGIRIGRKALRVSLGVLGAALVAAAATTYWLVADPFAGSLPEGWSKHHVTRLGATLPAPASYRASGPDADESDRNWVMYSDPSGAITIVLHVARKAEDTGHEIKSSAAAEMYAENDEFKARGDYTRDMPANPHTAPDGKTTFHGRPAAENTLAYTTTDSSDPTPREERVFYYRTSAGNMYQVAVSYPGKGDFTARGREVARTTLANLDIDKP
ncbi:MULTISPECIES: serine/threonine-protein kinase [unclassified Streptomyces]|uniref:serine/threonine-protein kinase n=1 Tax=unclassified Streptomyces TaxID=2593676 RepID=UPI001F27F093|nr:MULTISPECIES: serine/threonine-protein kinase [unclassified Streptomyces]MCF0089524.1 Serine/threonine-protein kinase PknA [Streptomyces sp. MH192]MCF0101587.1 Serine/threonine-protein kinase PknA [Streptomyces sp. MH191]